MGNETQKKIAGEEAAKLVKSGMVVGLGTGYTVFYTIQKLGERVKTEGLDIIGIPTSVDTETKARGFGIKLATIDEYLPELAIDGADEIDRNKQLIKGGGGALTREKVIDYRAKEFVVIADEGKLVKRLGEKSPLPIEVLPFCWQRLRKELEARFGFNKVELRAKVGKTYITDNKNYILDCFGRIEEAKALEQELNQIPGIVENGLFTIKVKEVIVGTDSGIKRF